MGFRNFLRRNGDLTAFMGGLTGLILPSIGIAVYESKLYADLYSQYQHPALMERSEMYATVAPVLGLIYLVTMGPLIWESITRIRRTHNNSHGTI